MFVDWFTVIAQIFNFLILIWLLKKFLYGPILEAIDEREKKISGQFIQARAETEAAVKERNDFLLKKEELEARRESMLQNASEEAEACRRRLMEEARREADELRVRLNDTLEKERDELRRKIAGAIKDEVFETARRALKDLADEALEDRMAKIFIDRLRALGEAEKNAVAALAEGASRTVTVKSAFELSEQRRREIESAFGEVFGYGAKIVFETSAGLVCGLELTAGGYRYAWSISDYLCELEKSVGNFLSVKTDAAVKNDEKSL